MKKYFIGIAFLCSVGIISCKKDEGGSCTTCSSTQTTDFEVCERNDGNASVNGQNTEIPYETYIADLIAAGASCGN